MFQIDQERMARMPGRQESRVVEVRGRLRRVLRDSARTPTKASAVDAGLTVLRGPETNPFGWLVDDRRCGGGGRGNPGVGDVCQEEPDNILRTIGLLSRRQKVGNLR